MADKFKLTIVTPEAVAADRQVESVTLPAYDGEIGLLAGHAPMVCRLGAGEVRIREGGTLTRLFIDGGVVQVRGDTATVLTNSAVAPEKLDADKARRELSEALARKVTGPAAQAARAADAARARARLRVAARVKR
jgi:F-type H+-transporting ATPase subunit epsilon